ncbi:SWIB/MDM2 domain-containing protein [Limnohabitans sp. DCL3]|uniref:SWIB/MDM2 domain-containing protein n=1 Tax=Limnohabitans sp. DCL3 TaxID=3374103 RepID=UPI003A87EB86
MATAKKTPAKKAAPAGKTAPAKKAAPAKKVAVSAPKAPAKKAAPAAKRTPNPAFMKALTPSAELAAVVGATPLPRTEVVSKMWVYIKKHNLQDSVNRRAINADDKLKAVFGKPQVTMFEMAGLIGKHLK